MSSNAARHTKDFDVLFMRGSVNVVYRLEDWTAIASDWFPTLHRCHCGMSRV